MIAKAKSISHGINYLNYVTGESKNKKSPEKISHICDNLLPSGMDPTAIWNAIKMTSMSHPRVINNIIRIELSPAKENTQNFTIEDWKNLWLDFVREFDRQELKDKKGKILSPRTNVTGSKYTVWLHEDSKSGIPHLHAAICRIDDEGNINNDSNIHLRAQRAAEKVAQKYGWQTAGEIRDGRKDKVADDCLDVLKNLTAFSFDEYFKGLQSKGYDVRIRTGDKGKVYGYILQKDGCRYKASEIGKGRHFTASKLEATWNAQHKEPEQKKYGSECVIDPDGDLIRIPDYEIPSDNSRQVNIKDGDNNYIRFIPESIMLKLEEEISSRELENWEELQNLTLFYFSMAQGMLAMFNTPYYNSSGGGGTSNDDLSKKREDLEEELKWLRRCAHVAKSKVGIIRKPRYKR